MEHLGAYTREQLKDSKYSTDVQVSHGIGNSSLPPKRTQFSSGESAEDSVSISQGGLNLLISTNQETVNPPKSDEHDVLNHTLQLSGKGFTDFLMSYELGIKSQVQLKLLISSVTHLIKR